VRDAGVRPILTGRIELLDPVTGRPLDFSHDATVWASIER
jgi:hypothetical protein